MRRESVIVFAPLALLAAEAAPAAETVALPRFEGIELKGGGSVVVRQGAVQRVTLVEGSTSQTGIRVEPRVRGGQARLVVDACKVRCPRDYRLRIEIVTPDISAVAVNGGGHWRVTATGSLAASVNGGGAIQYWGDPQVASSIRGGGAVTRGR